MKLLPESLTGRWNALARREQQVLGAGGAALAAMLFFLGVWEPLGEIRNSRAQDLSAARVVAQQIEALSVRSGGRRETPRVASAGRSLFAVVDQASKQANLGKAPTRLQPDGDDTVKVWFDDIPFDPLVRWMHELKSRHGVTVRDADVERESAPGRVNARLTLTRAG